MMAMIALMLASSVAAAHEHKYVWRGPVTVMRLPRAEMLTKCSCLHCNPPRDYRSGIGPNGGWVNACSIGGIYGYARVRGRCIIVLNRDGELPGEYEHELAHCGGMVHP